MQYTRTAFDKILALSQKGSTGAHMQVTGDLILEQVRWGNAHKYAAGGGPAEIPMQRLVIPSE